MSGPVPTVRPSAGDVARSVLFALVFYTGSIGAGILAPITALIGRRQILSFGSSWLRYHSWCARVILRIERRVEGTIPEGTFLFAAKHQSMYETMELADLLGDPGVLVKRQLAQIPLWGWAAQRWGVIPVDRDGSAVALREMLRASRAAMAEGRSILIFPEGTRVAPGETPPLRSGFAGLYRQLKTDVVPIALDSGLLCPRHKFVKRSGVVTIRIGEIIPAGLPRREAEAQVHAAINALERDPA
ncbi:MAG: glycerol acyltransferase [Sphingomonas bacterium]|nr:glycerol acyltransferase [Sphingomonas bacterium]